ncbi:MAG: hypothetical protein ACKVHQ_09545 [Gammaproteobacteria bacterium]|jgi:hypothetical protein
MNEFVFIFQPACSPSCDVIIRFYGGAPCAPPMREDSFVLSGDEDVLDELR